MKNYPRPNAGYSFKGRRKYLARQFRQSKQPGLNYLTPTLTEEMEAIKSLQRLIILETTQASCLEPIVLTLKAAQPIILINTNLVTRRVTP